MRMRWFGTRVFFGLAVAGLFLLVACGGGDGGGGGQTAQLLDFDVRVIDGIEAHVVVHAADGRVIAHKSVDVDTRQVSFTNVPQDAMVTAFARSVGQTWWTDANELWTHYELTTYPASYVAGRTFSFGFYGYVNVAVSGPCPEGADSVMVRPNGGYGSSYWAGCVVDPDTLENRFSQILWLRSSDLQTNGALSLLLMARAVWEPTHFALLLDRTPEDAVKGLSIELVDWRTDFGVNRLSLSFPELEPEVSASAFLQVVGRYKGRTIRPQWIVGRGLDSGVDGGTAEFEYARFPMDEVGAWQGLSVYESLADSFTSARTLVWDDAVTLPLDTSLTLGATLWPLPSNLEWVDGAVPTVSVEWSGPEPTSGYASLESRDYSDRVRRAWWWYWEGDAVAGGELLFPELPAALRAFVPVSSSPDFASTSVALRDYQGLDAALPSSAREVFIWRRLESAVVSGRDQPTGPLTPGEGMNESRVITLR